MNLLMLSGALVGLGAWLGWSGFRPATEPLAVAVARMEADTAPQAADPEAPEDRDSRIGRLLLGGVPPLRVTVDRVASDLRVVGRTPEEQAVRVGSQLALALLAGTWIAVVVTVADLPIPLIVPLGVSTAGCAWGLVMPFRRLRKDAAERRQEFSHALSAWCDVVVMSLAAGRGVEQAMETAADAGEGWAFAELRAAMRSGYVQGQTPWQVLSVLGAELEVKDLSELGSTIAMAGEEGAAVRRTVAAKARTIRERATSEAELAAAAATEKMSLPSVLLVVGFLLFLGFPAVVVMLDM